MKFARIIIKSVLLIVIITISIIVFRAYDSRDLPSLKAWHLNKPSPELLLNNDYSTFEYFVAADKQYISDNFKKIESTDYDIFERYNPNSVNYPLNAKIDYNASFIMDPGANTKGIIVLIHGLSDSPYHMRDIAKRFYGDGFYVFVLRMPGHGTLPSGLLDVQWQDWQKATRWSMNTANELAIERGGVPVYMGGFSTGGSLCVNYSLNALENRELNMPNKVFLFSPAAGVSSMGYVGGWHHTLSWMKYFSKFAWLDIIPEYDPAKYMSFTKNAGRQIFLLCKENMELAQQISKNNQQGKLPAFIAFESWVDATVSAKELVKLYDFIADSNDDLVLFDVNRRYAPFINGDISAELENMIKNKKVSYKLEFVSNTPNDSIKNLANIYTFNNNGVKYEVSPSLSALWASNVYSISHISVPISPSNELYGKESELSNMLIVGERNTLIIPSSDITRVRFNPFFNLMMKRIDEFIEDRGSR